MSKERVAWEKREEGVEYSSIHFSGARPIVIDENGEWHFWTEENEQELSEDDITVLGTTCFSQGQMIDDVKRHNRELGRDAYARVK